MGILQRTSKREQSLSPWGRTDVFDSRLVWVHGAERTLSAFGVMPVYGCKPSGSGCVYSAAASQLTSTGLPAWGCMHTPVYPHAGKCSPCTGVCCGTHL